MIVFLTVIFQRLSKLKMSSKFHNIQRGMPFQFATLHVCRTYIDRLGAHNFSNKVKTIITHLNILSDQDDHRSVAEV